MPRAPLLLLAPLSSLALLLGGAGRAIATDDGGAPVPAAAPPAASPAAAPAPPAPALAAPRAPALELEPAPSPPSAPRRVRPPAAPPAFGPGRFPPAPPPLPGRDPRFDVPIEPRFRLAVVPRLGYRLGEAGRAVSPAFGFGIGGSIDGRYAELTDHVHLLAGVAFSYDRFTTGERGVVTVDGTPQSFASTRVLSETSFLLTQAVVLSGGLLRPFVLLGAGLGLGYFDSAAGELAPGSASGAHFLARAAAGADLRLRAALNLNVTAGFVAVRGDRPLVTSDGRRLPLFGDLLDLGVGVAYRF